MKKRIRREASPLHPRRNGRRSPIRKSPARRVSIRRKAPGARIPPPEVLSLPEAGQNLKRKLLRVLIVEDLEDDALLMNRELERGGYSTQFQRVDTADRRWRRRWNPSLGTSCSRIIRCPNSARRARWRCSRSAGWICRSSSYPAASGKIRPSPIMKAGAGDYLRKENLSRLLPVVEREIREADIRKARVAAEEALRESETLYRTLIETSPDAIVVTDLETRIRMTNPQALRLLGVRSISEMEGKRLGRRLRPVPERSHAAHPRNPATDRTRGGGGDAPLTARTGRPSPPNFPVRCWPAAGRRRMRCCSCCGISPPEKTPNGRSASSWSGWPALRTIDAAITASMDLRVTLMVILDELTSQLRVDAADVLLLQSQLPSVAVHLRPRIPIRASEGSIPVSQPRERGPGRARTADADSPRVGYPRGGSGARRDARSRKDFRPTSPPR